MNYTRLFASTALVATLSLLAQQGQAQDATATPLGRIILGWGTDQVAIGTPQAVTVLNEDDIDQQQATTLGELFDQVPGVQSIGSDRVGGLSFNIRGIGELGSADESRIIVQVDGATKFYEQYRMGSFFSDPELYRRVEILRGPASSTLYGAGALGGVVTFETRNPSDFLDGDETQTLRFRTSYDSNGDGFMGSVIYATQPREDLEFLAALNYRQAGNYEDGDGTEISGSEFNSISGLLKATYHFGDDMSQVLTASYQIWDSDLDDTAYSQTGTLPFGTVDRHIRDQTLSLRWQNPAPANPWLDLDVVLSYSDTAVEQGDSSVPSPSPLFADSDYSYETLSLKVQNTMTMAGAGWENFLTYGIQLSRQDRVAGTTAGPLGFHPEGVDSRVGLFAQSELVFDNGLTLVPGIRLDFVNLEPAAGIAGTTTTTETAFSPKLAVYYEINDNWSVFGSIAQTQRVPTLDELFSLDSNEPSSPDLGMETSRSAELGFSFSNAGVFNTNDAFDLKVTAFYSELEDLIERDSTAGTPYYRNIASAEIYGIEIEAAYEAERLFGRLAYSDVRGEDTATGLTLTSIPARSLGLTLGGRAPDLGIEYGWRGYFVDDISYSAGNSFDSYAVHDLFMSWTPRRGAFEGFEIRASVENVLDETYQNSLAGDNGRGRTYRLTLSRPIQW
ncbi:TonB-dependent receptor [Rhodophyticola sp. CCM32]|nr:TonB-dependent receptor [Rhodophyticola sp. CCM32]